MDIDISGGSGPGLFQAPAALAARIRPGAAPFPDPAALVDPALAALPTLPEGVTSCEVGPEDDAIAAAGAGPGDAAAGAALEREARLQAIRDYIETCGAPEEKDQSGAPDETFWDYLQRQDDPKTRQGTPLLANQTWAVTVQDPDDPGTVHNFTVKTDAQGKARITRHMEFDSGDGEDRSKLTRRRAEDATAPGDTPGRAEAQAAAPAAQSTATRGEARDRRDEDRKA